MRITTTRNSLLPVADGAYMKPSTELSRRYKQIKLSPERRKEVNRIWHQDKKRHAEFFGGLSPAQEYDKHIEIRRKSDDY